MTLQPYQQASQQIKKQQDEPGKLLKNAAITGASIIGGGSIARMIPFLNKFIPSDMAIKGLSKISPGLGIFFNGMKKHGHTDEESLEFVKEKIKPAQEEKNIIRQYSDELDEFLKKEIQGGRPAIEAGALAQSQDKFKSAIKKMEGDHKTNFSSILQSVYGGGQHGGPVNPQQPQQQQPQTQAQQPQAQQSGQGDQALMQALQKILQM